MPPACFSNYGTTIVRRYVKSTNHPGLAFRSEFSVGWPWSVPPGSTGPQCSCWLCRVGLAQGILNNSFLVCYLMWEPLQKGRGRHGSELSATEDKQWSCPLTDQASLLLLGGLCVFLLGRSIIFILRKQITNKNSHWPLVKMHTVASLCNCIPRNLILKWIVMNQILFPYRKTAITGTCVPHQEFGIK